MSEPERGKRILTSTPRARFRGPRTPEQIEHAAQQEAEKRTVRMFAELQLTMKAELPENPATEMKIAPDTTTLALVPRGVVAVVIFGYFSRI